MAKVLSSFVIGVAVYGFAVVLLIDIAKAVIKKE